MKLFYKIFGYLICWAILLLACEGYVGYREEVRQFDRDMTDYAIQLGRAMASILGRSWQEEGEAESLALLRDAESADNKIKMRWVPFTRDNGDVPSMDLMTADQAILADGDVISFKKMGRHEEFRYTYVPVNTGEGISGAIELKQSLLPLRQYARKSLVLSMTVGLLLLLLSGLMSYGFFKKNIRTPLDLMIRKTRRISDGDLRPDLMIIGHDELSELARVINTMCESIYKKTQALNVECSARIDAMEQLRHTERLSTIGQLATGMAHEMGTPLNVISGRAKLIAADDMDKAEIVECAAIIREQADRMTKTIRQLLDFARRKKPHYVNEDIELVIKTIFNLLLPVARKQNVEMVLENRSDTKVISIDPSQIQQVLINIIMNGIQEMTAGGRLAVTMDKALMASGPDRSGPADTYLIVRISDEGDGISEETMQRLFEPFYTTKDVGKGTGLGLSIAQGIIEEHGGWIEASNNPDKGAMFSIYLPVEHHT